ncbi:MAG TPA: ribonuclease III [Patescibacteria group bacterium]
MKQLPKFINQELFQKAFTHRSFLNESKKKVDSNERLEFLGDSILSFVMSQELFTRYPQYHEGTLTNLRSLLVNTKILGETARELEFGNLLRLSKGEEEAKGRENQSLLADAYEAFVGALFLDQGLEIVSEFIKDTLFPKIEEIVAKKTFKDPKSLFQEQMQAQTHASPLYKVLTEEGPSHAKIFTVGVFVKDVKMGEGRGKSKQEAEENAAKEALEKKSK